MEVMEWIGQIVKYRCARHTTPQRDSVRKVLNFRGYLNSQPFSDQCEIQDVTADLQMPLLYQIPPYRCNVSRIGATTENLTAA